MVKAMKRPLNWGSSHYGSSSLRWPQPSHPSATQSATAEQRDIDRWHATPRVDIQLEVAVKKWKALEAWQSLLHGCNQPTGAGACALSEVGRKVVRPFLPVAVKVPYMHTILAAAATADPLSLMGNYLDLLGNARFRTSRVRCLTAWRKFRRWG